MSATYSGLFASRLLAAWILFLSPADPGQGKDPIDAEFEFRPELRKVLLARDGRWFLGFLDSDGRFLTSEEVIGGVSLPYLLPPAHNYPIAVKGVEEPVYEFRSGLLTKGILDGFGNFVPQVGSTIIAFKAYRPGKDALRIYNLPGQFVPKVKAGPKGPDAPPPPGAVADR